MPNFGPIDDDVRTCPYCGHREYPEVGMSYHHCPARDAALAAESREFERRHFGSRKIVRTVVVVEHYDTDECFTSALESIHTARPHADADPILGWQYVVVKGE